MTPCVRLRFASFLRPAHAGRPSRNFAWLLLSVGLCAFTRSGSAQPGGTPAEPGGETQASGAAPAPSKEALQEAGEHYGRGLNLYAEGEYALAAIEFDRAYALVPDYRVLYNVGQVRIQLSNYAKARRALDRYLSEGGDKIEPERQQSVKHDLQMLSLRTGTLRVQTNVEGAQISVDDVPAGLSPLADSLLLDAGDHRVSVRKLGFEASDSRLTLVGGDTLSTRVDLVAERSAPPPRVIVEKQFVEKSDHTTWVWATWSATGVFAVSGAVIGGFGLKAANELDQLRSNPDATRGQLDSTQRRARTLLGTADVLGAAALVSGGVALFLTLSNRSETSRAPAKRADGAHFDLAFSPNWLGVKGRF